VLRLGPGGEPVAAFGGDGLATVNFGQQETANAVSFAPSGAIDIGGYVSNGSTMRSALARLRPNGTLDPAFGGDGRQILDLSAGAEQVNELVVMPTYTAMLALRKVVGERGFVRPYWERAA